MLAPSSRHPTSKPTTNALRWVAVAAIVAAAVVTGRRINHLSANPAAPAGVGARGVATTVLRHPEPGRSLEQRWDWARAEARRLGVRAAWIGYYVRSSLLVDLRGLALPGPQLAELVGLGERPDDLAVLLRVPAGGPPLARHGSTGLQRVHVGGFRAPVDLGEEPLFWLGMAEDGASLARLEQLFTESSSAALKEDLVAAVGLHGSSAVVVPLLQRWSVSTERPNVRAEAAKWLRHHGRPQGNAPGTGVVVRGMQYGVADAGPLDSTKDFVNYLTKSPRSPQ
jgi:hypothetical protein